MAVVSIPCFPDCAFTPVQGGFQASLDDIHSLLIVIKQTGMLALFAVPTLGLQARPALLAPCSAIHRCAPPRALHYDGNENRIDHDDDDEGDECVITNTGVSCFNADVAAGMTLNGHDAEPRAGPAQNDEERRRRSPGMVADFGSKSTEDFKKSYDGSPTEAEPTEAEKILDENLIQGLRAELESQHAAMAEADGSPSEAAPVVARPSRVPVALRRAAPKAIGSTIGMFSYDTPHHIRVPTMR